MTSRQNLQGNHACALAAIAAGCRFYGGYPITPSSEIAERMSLELPRVGGVFIQMEDEIASMGAVIGASMGGAKAMTATSGPGFSLKQENLGYAAMTEIPCVIVNVMRGGPSTGLPTRPAQGDIMQARWGTHGDHPILVLTPARCARSTSRRSARSIWPSSCARRSFCCTTKPSGIWSKPSIFPIRPRIERAERKWATGPREDFLPYADPGDGIPAMARPGDGYRCHTTGLTHGEHGFPTQNPADVDRMMQRLLGKLDRHRDLIDALRDAACRRCRGAGGGASASPPAPPAAPCGRRAPQGVRAGLFRPITLWPFPEQAFREHGGARLDRAGGRR